MIVAHACLFGASNEIFSLFQIFWNKVRSQIDVGSSEEAVATFEGIGILTPRCVILETIDALAFPKIRIRYYFYFLLISSHKQIAHF